MNIHYPIYNLLHQDIKACADHLLEIGRSSANLLEEHAPHIFSRLSELHQFALKVHHEEHYFPLIEFKFYLENTIFTYEDATQKLQSICLSEAVRLLGIKEAPFDPVIVSSLKRYFVKYFHEESQPGKPLFSKLKALKKL